MFGENEILGDLSKTTLELKENLANSRIPERPFAVGTDLKLGVGTGLWFESGEEFVDVVGNTRTRIDIRVEVDSDAALKKVKSATGKCKVSAANMLIPLTTMD